MEVDRGAVGGAGDAALAVDEHERAVRAGTAEIDEREPSAILAPRTRRTRLLALLHTARKADRRLLRERAADVELRVVILERVRGHDADRRRQVEPGPADARNGHDNVIAALYRLVAGRFDRFLCMCGEIGRASCRVRVCQYG